MPPAALLVLPAGGSRGNSPSPFRDLATSLPPSLHTQPHPRTPPLLPPLQDYTPERKAYENRRKVSFFQDDSCRRMYRDHVRAVSE